IPENRLAKALVSNACWTLRAAVAGKPLWQLLGGREEADVCWTVTRRAPAEMAAESADYCARYGFRTLKVKGGQGIQTDLRALGIYAESALGTLVNMHLPATLAAEQSFFLLMPSQVVVQVPPICGGRLRLPSEPDLSRLVDWQAVQRYRVAP